MKNLYSVKKRRAVGTIVGAAFFLLILAQAITFLYTNMKQNYELNEAYNKAYELDKQQIQEKLDLINILPDSGSYLNISIKNIGHVVSKIKYIGEVDEANNNQSYNLVDYTLQIGEKATNIADGLIHYQTGDKKKILFLTELGNVFTFVYPLPPGNGENGDGNSLVTITGINSVVYNPNSFNLLGSTSHIGGTVADLVDDDGTYLIFGSYSGGVGVDKIHYIDNDVSNVDGVADKGSHSNFSAQQSGPDSIIDNLLEANIGPYNTTLINFESFEGGWPPTGWSETPSNGKWNKETDQAYDGSYSADFDGPGSGDLMSPSLDLTGADAIYIEFWYRDGGCGDTEFLLEYYDGSSWNSIMDLGSTTNENQWLYYNEKITDPQYMNSDFQVRWVANNVNSKGMAYVDYVTVKGETSFNYELDLEVQFTGVDFTQSNEVLALYIESESSEPLMLDVWDGGSWINVFTDVSVGWNNASISTYLTSSTLTLRFKGSNDLLDYSQDIWGVDALLLHLWSGSSQEIIEAEFYGTSNTRDWETLFWQIDSSFNVSLVPVSISLYNFESRSYCTSGDGYISYVSQVRSVDESRNQTLKMDLTRFKDSSGNWRARLYANKVSLTPIQLNLDLIGYETTYETQSNDIQYNTWQEYRVRAVTVDGKPVSYGYASIYHNGTALEIRDEQTQAVLSNPDWVYLNENGEFNLELRSSNPLGEVFTINVTVGDAVGSRKIKQFT